MTRWMPWALNNPQLGFTYKKEKVLGTILRIREGPEHTVFRCSLSYERASKNRDRNIGQQFLSIMTKITAPLNKSRTKEIRAHPILIFIPSSSISKLPRTIVLIVIFTAALLPPQVLECKFSTPKLHCEKIYQHICIVIHVSETSYKNASMMMLWRENKF